jgi:hypothetical protein
MWIVGVNFGTAFARPRHLAGELIEVAEVLLARKTELGRIEAMIMSLKGMTEAH